MSTAAGAFPGFGADAPLDLAGLSSYDTAQVLARLRSGRFDDWARTAASVGHCARPIRLRGSSTTVDTGTGQVLSSFSAAAQPLGQLYLRCGNRRASVCPSCSRLYAADTFQMIRAGVAGGKGVPVHVGLHPLVFATLTGPSFGTVHGMRPNGARCRPRTRDQVCQHGEPVGCMAVHTEGDRLLGVPICAKCYDYESSVIWQWWAPELWRRFTITLRRNLSRMLGIKNKVRLDRVVTVHYAKVAEYQARGVVHFHALVRLDGPKTEQGFAPAPAWITADMLAEVVRASALSVRFSAPAAYVTDPGRVLAFGDQVDTKVVQAGRRTDDTASTLTAEQVAGYLAKYATKSATDVADSDRDSEHLRRLRATARDIAAIALADKCQTPLAEPSPYLLMGKWVHMLAFRGHFSTKSRRYSVTLGALRNARRRFHVVLERLRTAGQPHAPADVEAVLLTGDQHDDETTLVVGDWTYAGTAWDTPGDAALARAASARAREYAQWRAARKHTKPLQDKGTE